MLIRNTPKKLYAFCIAILFLIGTAKSQQHKLLPLQLSGNWFLQTNTNEWVVGFYEKLVYFKNDFWHYKIVAKKEKEIQFSLQKGNTNFILSVAIKSDSVIQVQVDSSVLLLTNSKRRMASLENENILHPKKTGKDTAWIKGYLDHRTLTDIKNAEVRVRNLVSGETEVQAAQVDKDGQFRLRLPLQFPSAETIFEFGGVFEYVILRPGDTAIIYIDLLPYKKATTESEIRNTDNKMVIAGSMGAFNNEYRDYSWYIKKWNDYEEQNNMIFNSEQDIYMDYELKRRMFTDSLLQAYGLQYGLSKALSNMIKQRNKYHLANSLLRYRWLHDRENKVKLSPEYLALPNSFIADDDEAHLAGFEFDGFTSEVMNNMVIAHLSGRTEIDSFINKNASLAKALEYIQRYGNSLTADMLKNMDSLKNYIPYFTTSNRGFTSNITIKDTAEQKKIFRQFNNLFQFLSENDDLRYYFASLELYYRLAQIDSLFSKGIFRDYLLGHYICFHFFSTNRLEFLDDDILSKVKTMYSDSAAYAIIEKENLRMRRKFDTEQYEDLLSTALPGEEETVINKIARQNKGKVIFIDIWATWCAPCIEQFPYSLALKKHFEGKPIEFVYLCADSAKDKWQSLIKKYGLSGQHFLLTSDEISRLRAKYDFMSSPRYMIINKEGKLVSENSARPEVKEILIPKFEYLLR